MAKEVIFITRKFTIGSGTTLHELNYESLEINPKEYVIDFEDYHMYQSEKNLVLTFTVQKKKPGTIPLPASTGRPTSKFKY